MHDEGGHAWQGEHVYDIGGGMHGEGGVHGEGGHAW